jgi:hypothetical protein
MSQVSRPVLLALIAAAAFAGVWFVALRPKADSASTSSPAPQSAPGVTGLKRAVDKAHGVVNDSNRAPGVAHPATPAPRSTAPAPAGPAPAGKAPATPASPAPARPATPPSRYHGAVGRVERALNAHRTVAILFYNPASADDRSVKASLDHIDRHHGLVDTFAAPISEVSRYGPITTKAAVFGSPTVVVVPPSGQAGALTGFVDPVELQQRIDDASGFVARSHHRRAAAHRGHHRRAAKHGRAAHKRG